LSRLVLSYYVLSYLVLSCLALSCLVFFFLVLPCLALSCLVLPCLVLSYDVLCCVVLCCLALFSCAALPYLVLSCLVWSCLVWSCPVFLYCLVLCYVILLSCLVLPWLGLPCLVSCLGLCLNRVLVFVFVFMVLFLSYSLFLLLCRLFLCSSSCDVFFFVPSRVSSFSLFLLVCRLFLCSFSCVVFFFVPSLVSSFSLILLLFRPVAKAFGASVVGITGYDPRWHYKAKFSRYQQQEKSNSLFPESRDARNERADAARDVEDLWSDAASSPRSGCVELPNVIVIGTAMDVTLVETVPSALGGAAVGMGYSKDALSLLTIAQYIRNLGYLAVPSMNDTANAIPYAIQAGLGEYGRNGLLITPRLGPRLRLGKIFTDMPLSHDAPIKFGVKEFCQQCNLCAKGR
jgi:hypothetical protein